MIWACILLSSCILFVCDFCAAYSFCDNPDWIPSCDGWEHSNKASGTSTLSCDETRNTCVTVRGPCEVRFKWGISRGYNELRFIDNGNPTRRHLPTKWDNRSHVPHDSEEDCVNYSIRDNLIHELKWEHKNPHSQGNAWIAELRVCNADFKNEQPVPKIGISDDKFNYSVDVESPLSAFDVELFVIPPNTRANKEIPLGPRTYHQGAEHLEWGPVILDCNDVGMGNYRFRIGSPINESSVVYDGPLVVVFKDPLPRTETCTNNKSNCTYCYCIDIKTLVNARVELMVSDDNVVWYSLGTRDLRANEQNRLCWYTDHAWKSIRYPVSYDI